MTGAAGFLGSHLCDRLLDAGHSVVGLDNFSTGHRDHVAHLLSHPQFTLIEHDVIVPLPAAAGADAATHVFNLACPASPAHYQRHPVETTLANTLGTWRLLELVRQSGARLLHTSTSEVYGDPQVHPQNESYHGHVNPNGPRSCYDEGKRCAEALCFAYRRQYAVPIRVVRLFNSYGPRLRAGDGRVVSNFIVQALRGEPLTVYGHGRQTRSFCFVSDTVEGMMRMMDADVEGPLNIGNPTETTVLALAEAVLRLTGSQSSLRFAPLPADDPHRRRPDIGRATQHLKWQPRIDLEDGLRTTIAYFRAELQRGVDEAFSANAA